MILDRICDSSNWAQSIQLHEKCIPILYAHCSKLCAHFFFSLQINYVYNWTIFIWFNFVFLYSHVMHQHSKNIPHEMCARYLWPHFGPQIFPNLFIAISHQIIIVVCLQSVSDVNDNQASSSSSQSTFNFLSKLFFFVGFLFYSISTKSATNHINICLLQ